MTRRRYVPLPAGMRLRVPGAQGLIDEMTQRVFGVFHVDQPGPLPKERRGNCYVASEALYHLLGGKRAGWTPMRVRVTCKETHWFLKHRSGLILDPTRRQFLPRKLTAYTYSLAVGSGFLTKRPSRRARALMERIVWQ